MGMPIFILSSCCCCSHGTTQLLRTIWYIEDGLPSVWERKRERETTCLALSWDCVTSERSATSRRKGARESSLVLLFVVVGPLLECAEAGPYGHMYTYRNLNFFAKFVFVYTNHSPYGYISSHKFEGQLHNIRFWAQISHINELHFWVKLELTREWSSFYGTCMCATRTVDTHTHTKRHLSNILLSLRRCFQN